MTELLRQAFARLERMPVDAQDEIARALLGLSGDDADEIEPEHRAAVDAGRRQAERKQFSILTPDEAITAAFRRRS